MSSVPRTTLEGQEAGASSDTSDRRAHARRVAQCQQWNTNAAHQALAGKARAAQFTPESQAEAGHASFAAFSARWRASQGLAPLVAEDVRRYVTPAMIRSLLGLPLSAALQETIWQAWCAGRLLGVAAWLSDDPPPDPHGLWAQTSSQPATSDTPDTPDSEA